MKKTIIITSVAIILIVIVAGLYASKNILDYSSRALGRSVETNDIDINWGWPVTRIALSNVEISNMEGGSDPVMLSVDKAVIGVNLFSLLKGTLAFDEVSLEKPYALLEKDAEGNANWHFGKNPVAGATLESLSPDDRSDFPVIENLTITDGKIIYKDPAKKIDVTLVTQTVQGQASSEKNLQFDGKGKYQKDDFKIAIKGGNIFRLKDTSEPYPIDINISAGPTTAKVKGTVLDPFELKGLNVKLSLKGQDASDLFNLIGVALPPTPPYDVTGDLNYVQDKWNFRDFKGKLGDSDLHGSVTWDTQGERPLLSGEFISNNLDFKDLGGLVGAPPSAKQEASAYIIPDTPLDISRLSAMDAHITFTGKKMISSNLPLDDFYMKVDLVNSILKLNPIRFGAARGDISSVLTVNAQQEPVKINGEFTFSRLSLKPIFEKITARFGIKNVTDGYLGGTAKLAGTGKSLRQMLSNAHGDIGIGMEGGQLSNLVVELLGLDAAQTVGFLLKGDEPVPIRCMIGDFAVNNGVMDVRRFVLDTTDSNIIGKGNINLKNEKLNMTLNTYPKDTTLVSLNTPIRLTGTLKNPEVNVSMEKIVGRGAVAAIGAVIFPVLGLMPFIEVGLGKDSNCAKLIHAMEKNTDTHDEPSLIPKNVKAKNTK